jgi:NADPH:quinone reductase-like Zn-dependent oxidoreductase
MEPQEIDTLEKVKPMKGFMKAVRIHKYGDSSVLTYEDAPIPGILPDEVLIKVHSAGVNPVDWKIREGYRKDSGQHQLPLTLGWDVAGTIEKTGSMVSLFKKGDAVIARPDMTLNGAYAEYVAVRAFELAIAPMHVPLQQAAGIPRASQTAWVGLFEQGNLNAKQRILIHGASGGVGSFAIQFAKIAGAYVIGTASGKHTDYLKSLGIDEVIDYTKEDFSKKIKDLDMVFDTIGGETQAKSFGLIRKGGTLVSTVGADEKQAEKHGVKAKSFMMISNGSRLQEIVALVDQNMIRIEIEKEFHFSDAKQAHELSQEGHVKGKIILRVQ